MAQLDFGLLNTNAPAQIAGAYGRGQQEAQANQLAQLQMRQQTASTQNAEMNLTRLQQEHDALDKLMTEITANGGPSDPMQAADMMIKSKIPEYFKRGLEMKQSYAQLNSDRVAMGLPPLSSAAAPAPAVSSNRVNEPNAAPGVQVFKVNEPPAPVNSLAAQTQAPIEPDKNALMMQAKAKLLSPNVGVREAGKLEMQQLLSPKEPVYHNVVGVGLVDPRTGRVVTPSVEKPPAPPTSAAEYELAKKDPNFMRFLQERAAATRAPIQPVQPSAPVAVVDPVTGKQIYVSREDALRGRMTPAAAMESLNPKEIQKREALLPQATQSLKTVNNTMSIIGQTVDKLLANPNGINGITGLIGGVTPALTDAARAAKADLEQLKNLAFVQGLTELRAASKTGAGVGNVSNREGDRFENLKASLDRSQSKEDLIASLRKLKSQADFTAQTMQEAYDSTYSYKSGGGTAAPASSTGIDASNPLLK